MGFKFCSALSTILAICLVVSLASGIEGREAGFATDADVARDFQGASSKSSRRLLPCTSQSPCTVHMIADLDHASKIGDDKKPQFKSELMSGRLIVENATTKPAVKIEWFVSEPLEIVGKFAEEGRGMELSELVMFNDSLLAFDDRTGIVYELLARSEDAKLRGSSDHLRTFFEDISVKDMKEAKEVLAKVKIDPVAKVVLTEGDGERSPKGMKIEWACEKDSQLYIGSFGKEYTSNDGSQILSTSNMWIAIIDNPHSGEGTQRVNWTRQYEKLREMTWTQFPGYMIHEAVNWSPIHRKWFFLPRRISSEAYNVTLDEKRGANKILVADEDFTDVSITEVKYPTYFPERGFSSFKFLPGSDDQIIVALRSAEDEALGKQETFLSVFSIAGELILDEVQVSANQKYEGLEIW